MTAPDRIWILPSDLREMLAWAPNQADTIVAAQFPLKNMNGEIASVEYIRKGAFPVEEIRRQVGVLSQAPKFLQGSDLALFRGILSLLEGDADEQL